MAGRSQRAAADGGDRKLAVVFVALAVFGLVMITSAGAAYAQVRFDDLYFFLKRQTLFGVLPGMFLFIFFSRFDYRRLRSFAPLVFFVSVSFLVLVLIPGLGTSAYGATRWLELGPISFQPSEFVKLSLVLYLAAWFSGRSHTSAKSTAGESTVVFVCIMALVGFLIMKQPDMGTLGIIVLVAGGMFFLSGARISHIALLAGGALALALALIKVSPYRWNRLAVFLNPQLDPQGSGYQISQALLAIGSGGIFGLGLGNSRQKFNYLPEPAGDSIFAVIGEELGLFGAVVVVAVFAFVMWRGFRIAQTAPDDFGRMLAIGISLWFTMQALINIAAITGIAPLTGIPLPFISYGPTALAVALAGAGILINISAQCRAT